MYVRYLTQGDIFQINTYLLCKRHDDALPSSRGCTGDDTSTVADDATNDDEAREFEMVIIIAAVVGAAVIVVTVVVAVALCRSKRYKSTQAQDPQAVGSRPVAGATPQVINPSTQGTHAVFLGQQDTTLGSIYYFVTSG